MNNDRISVIIPAYNSSRFIESALESVLSQAYKNFEIIVVDDGSSDNTKEVIKRFIDKGLVSYYYQSNKGPAAARNMGIKQASGEIIAFLDADDLWLENKLEKSLRFMKEGSFDWICTSLLKINESGEKKIKRIPDDSWVMEQRTKEVKQLKNGLFFFASIPVQVQTVLAKKECFHKAGLFDESFLIGEDTDLWLRFEEIGFRCGYLDEPLTIYRYNEISITKSKKNDGLHDYGRLGKKHAVILGLEKTLIRTTYSELLWKIADDYLEEKHILKAFRYILRSLFYNPRNFLRIINKLK